MSDEDRSRHTCCFERAGHQVYRRGQGVRDYDVCPRHRPTYLITNYNVIGFHCCLCKTDPNREAPSAMGFKAGGFHAVGGDLERMEGSL